MISPGLLTVVCLYLNAACSGSQSYVGQRGGSSHTLHIEHDKNAQEYKTRFIIVFQQMGERSAAPLCKMELYIFFLYLFPFTIPLVLTNQATYCILHGIGNDGVSFIFNSMIFVCNPFHSVSRQELYSFRGPTLHAAPCQNGTVSTRKFYHTNLQKKI
jgi:hypothetical protein